MKQERRSLIFTLIIVLLFLYACTPIETEEAKPVSTSEFGTVDTPQETVSSSESTATPSAESIVHIVQAGETLGGIAKEYGITVETLVTLNNIDDPDKIKVGQELVISVPQNWTPIPTSTSLPGSPTATPKKISSPTPVPLKAIRQEVEEQLDERDLKWSDTEVEVVDGRPTGGEKAILIKYNTDWPYDSQYYWEDMGGCFGAAGQAMLKLDTDFDVVIVIMGDHDTKQHLESYMVEASKLVAFLRGEITASEFDNALQIVLPP